MGNTAPEPVMSTIALADMTDMSFESSQQAMFEDAISRATFRAMSWHFDAGPLSTSTRPCKAYNTATCPRGLDCNDSHDPDAHSIRRLICGPNVCKAHLLGPHGCPAPACPYAHRLDMACLPLHDKQLVRRELLELENKTLAPVYLEMGDLWAKMQESGGTNDTTISDEDDRVRQVVNLQTELFDLATSWMDERTRESREQGVVRTWRLQLEILRSKKTPAVDVTGGVSGAALLRQLGVKAPFAGQRERIASAIAVVRDLKSKGLDIDD